MTRKELVSVVIPAYNPPKDKFIICLNSIQQQDYKEIDIIIIDDGSEPEIASFMDKYAATHDNARVIHQKNGGEGAARNTGIDNVRGKYVVFVDADDALAEGWLSYSIDLAEQYDADIISGRVVMCSEINELVKKTSKLENYEYKYFPQDELWRVQKDSLYDYTNLVEGLSLLDPGVCSKLIRADIIQNIRFPLGIKLSSDQVYNHSMLYNSKSYVVSNRESYFYIMNENSISHIYQPKAVDYMMHSMSLVKENLLDDERVRQAFYYRIFVEITSAIKFAYYSDRKKCTFFEKLNGIRYAGNQALVREAASEIDLNNITSKSWKIKMKLIKRRWYLMYLILKEITDKKDNLSGAW